MIATIGAARRGPDLAGHPGDDRPRARRHPAPRRRHDLAAARDDRGRPADGHRRPRRARHRHVARRGRRAGPGVQLDGRGARRGRPAAPRAGRQRQPRAADAAGRAVRACWRTSPTASPSPTPATLRAALDAGRADDRTWSPTCSTSPGSTPARRRSPASPSRSGRCWRPPSPRPGSAGRDVDLRRRGRAGRPRRRGRPRPPAPARRQPPRQRLAAQPARRHRDGPGAGRRSTSRWHLEVVDEGPGVAPAHRERAFERFGTLARGRDRRRRDRPRARHRPLGHRPARRDDRLRRPRARDVRRPRPRRPPDRTRPTHPPGGERRARTARHPRTARAATPAPAPDDRTRPSPPRSPTRLFGDFWPDRGVPGNVRGPARRAGRRRARRRRAAVPRPRARRRSSSCSRPAASLLAASRHRRDPFTLGLRRPVPRAGRGRRPPGRRVDRRCSACSPAPALGAVGLVRGRTRPVVRRWPRVAVAARRRCAGCPGWGAPCGRHRAGQRGGAAAHGGAGRLLGVTVFALLFASADALFAEWVGAVVPDLGSADVRRCACSSPSSSAASCSCGALPRPQPAAPRPRRARAPGPVAHRFEWLAPVLVVDAVFVVFLVAQADGRSSAATTTSSARPASPTRSTCTRASGSSPSPPRSRSSSSGRRRARRRATTPSDRTWIRVSLGLLCALTLVVVASALYRMHLYEQAYGLTRLRLLVACSRAGSVSWCSP